MIGDRRLTFFFNELTNTNKHKKIIQLVFFIILSYSEIWKRKQFAHEKKVAQLNF